VQTLKIKRPWGSFEVIAKGKGFWLKELTIKPMCSTSLQYHYSRDEVFVVLRGTAKIQQGAWNSLYLGPAPSVHIPRSSLHKIKNMSDEENLIVFELAVGDPDEKDIVRVEDDYGRATDGA